MRVVHLNQDAGTGPRRSKGAAVHVNALREAFAQKGCEVLPVDGGSPEDGLARLSVEHARAPIDLVYERYALGADAGARFARASGVPLVLEVNAPLLEEASMYRSGGLPKAEVDVALERDRVLERSIFGAAARILAVSSQVARYVADTGAQAGRTLEERIWVRPNGYDPERFHPRLRATARERLSIPPSCFVVGFHGRLRPWHGFETIAAALERLVDRVPDLRLILAGTGDFRAHVAGTRLEVVTTRIDWVPHAEVGAVVSTFDALPLGYVPGGPDYFSPLKLFEAMACGVVPVAPDVGDLPLHVTQGRSGVVYPAGDVAALSQALAGLPEDVERRQRLAQGAILAAGPHTWGRIAADVLSLVPSRRTSGTTARSGRQGL